jgi:hypothetical protein
MNSVRLAAVVTLAAACLAHAVPQALSPIDAARRPPISDPASSATIEPLTMTAAPMLARAQPQRDPDDPFVPVDELPPEEQLPAAPLLVSAYAFVLVALFAYLISVARRLGTVQADVERLERDLKKSGRT